MAFDGLGMHLGNLSRISDAESRSISPENFTGEPGRGGMAPEGTGSGPARALGQGWKVLSLSCFGEPNRGGLCAEFRSLADEVFLTQP